MSVARKESRPIVVDGVTYCWRINGDGIGHGLIDVAIAPVKAPGTTLLFRTAGEHANTSAGYYHPVVRPARIAEVIRLALRRGWRADEPGKPFDLWPHLPAQYQRRGKSVLRPSL